MGPLSELNSVDDEQAIALLEPLIERAPAIAANVARRRPFDSADDLRDAIWQELLNLDDTERVGLFQAHPELAPDNPLAMTNSSQSEQGRLKLTSGDNEYPALLADLNARYRSKFGFPFITALVRHKDIDSVLTEFAVRLAADRTAEIEQTIDQIFQVSSSRVRAAFGHNNADAPQETDTDTTD